jgi:hypothetical protein
VKIEKKVRFSNQIKSKIEKGGRRESSEGKYFSEALEIKTKYIDIYINNKNNKPVFILS